MIVVALEPSVLSSDPSSSTVSLCSCVSEDRLEQYLSLGRHTVPALGNVIFTILSRLLFKKSNTKSTVVSAFQSYVQWLP